MAAFVILRGINGYGDPVRWSTQKSAAFTALSFLNTNKYPPSLLFLLMTLGPALLLLWAVDRARLDFCARRWSWAKYQCFITCCTSAHSLAGSSGVLRALRANDWMFESPTIDKFPFTQPPGWGFPLPVIYLIWAGVVVALYPLCRWFAALKQRRSDAWLSYL